MTIKRSKEQNRERYMQRRREADPNYQPREVSGFRSEWSEENLTEPWVEYRARKQAERAGRR